MDTSIPVGSISILKRKSTTAIPTAHHHFRGLQMHHAVRTAVSAMRVSILQQIWRLAFPDSSPYARPWRTVQWS